MTIDFIEIRNWTILILAVIGAFITIRTFINSIKTRKIDNTYKTLDFIRKHITKDQIDTFIILFQANNPLTGIAENEFVMPHGKKRYIEDMFSEGGIGNGNIHNMIELFNLLSKSFKKLEFEIIWYEYGQIISTLYKWTNYLEKTEVDKDYYDKNRFYYSFNRFMENQQKKLVNKAQKHYTYAE